MNEENEEKSITISEIWRRIWSQKWLFLAIIFAVTLVGTLVVQFAWNRTGRKEYVVGFSLNLPDDGQTDEQRANGYRYSDGNVFYFGEYISEKTLATVKDSNPAFESLDIATLAQKEAISCTETYSAGGGANEKDNFERRTFEIRAEQRYFANETQARAFLTALAEYPVTLQQSTLLEENIYLREDDYKNALTFEDQIEYLRKQIDYLSGRYLALAEIANFSADKQSFDAWAQRQDLDSLLVEARVNNYLKDYNVSIGKYENLLKEIDDKIEDKKAVLEGVTGVVPGAGAMSSDNLAGVVRDLEDEITNLTRQKTTMLNYIDAYYPGYKNSYERRSADPVVKGALDAAHVQEAAAFSAKIDSVYNNLVGEDGYIAHYEDLRDKVYSNLANVVYSSSRVVTEYHAHDVGLAITLVVSLLLGVLLGGVVAFIVGTTRLRVVAAAKEKEAASSNNGMAVIRGSASTKNEQRNARG